MALEMKEMDFSKGYSGLCMAQTVFSQLGLSYHIESEASLALLIYFSLFSPFSSLKDATARKVPGPDAS